MEFIVLLFVFFAWRHARKARRILEGETVREVKPYFSEAAEADGRRAQGVVFWILSILAIGLYVLYMFSQDSHFH